MRVFWPTDRGYPETATARIEIRTGDWQPIRVASPEDAVAGLIRVEPLDRPGLIEFRDFAVTAGGAEIWRLDANSPDSPALQGTAFGGMSQGTLVVIGFGNSSSLLIPVPACDAPPAGRIELELRAAVRVRTDFASAAEAIYSWVRTVPEPKNEPAAQPTVAYCPDPDLARELEDIRRSLSWRLTAPLRTFAGALGYRGAPRR